MLHVMNWMVRSTTIELLMSLLTLEWDAVHEASRIVRAYNAFVDRIEALELSTAVDLNPLLNVGLT
jgi:hypothetical protein